MKVTPLSSVVINLDGKTLLGTIPAGQSKGVHMLAAYLPEEGWVLFQVEVSSWENEIPAQIVDAGEELCLAAQGQSRSAQGRHRGSVRARVLCSWLQPESQRLSDRYPLAQSAWPDRVALQQPYDITEVALTAVTRPVIMSPSSTDRCSSFTPISVVRREEPSIRCCLALAGWRRPAAATRPEITRRMSNWTRRKADERFGT